jgi:stage II sporulation protein Q
MIAEVIIMREEEKKSTSKFRRILKKRWALPAIYIASAALILALVFIIQTSFTNTANNDNTEESAETGQNIEEPAVEVNSSLEKIQMPIADVVNSVIKKPFYDVNADEKEQEEALVFYNNRYEPNKGIDIASKDGKAFEVVASLSGNVTKVQEDALLGNVIEVEHEDGVVTRYQSVTDIQVAVGDEVKQGDVLATASKSQINEAAGTHVHFEIRKDSVALNPVDLMDKQVSAIQEAAPAKEEAETESASSKEEATEEPSSETKEAPVEEPAKEPAKEETGNADQSKENSNSDAAEKNNDSDSSSEENTSTPEANPSTEQPAQ